MDNARRFYGLYGGSFGPSFNENYSFDDIKKRLNTFTISSGLSCIAQLSAKIGFYPKPINNIKLCNSILAYLTMALIDSSSDSQIKNKMTIKDLLEICKMWYGLELVDPSEDITAWKRRHTRWQFDYQKNVRYFLPRTISIYNNLWHINPKSRDIDILDYIGKCFGLSLDEIILIGHMFFGRALKWSGLVKVDKTFITKHSEKLYESITVNNINHFINIFACDYLTFRNKMIELNSEDYLKSLTPQSQELYKFNPLNIYPVIKPEKNIFNPLVDLYLLPLPKLLYEAITQSLYFKLDVYLKSINIDFPSKFGNVFEMYAGELLKHALKKEKIISENELLGISDKTKIPDWIVIDEEKAVLIEVKTSTLHRKAKTTGFEQDVIEDLRNNLSKGVLKLYEFENYIKSGGNVAIDNLSKVKIFEKLIVTYDDDYFMNSDLRDLIINDFKRNGGLLTEGFHWHAMSIEEFEPIVGVFGNDLFSYLEKKRLDPELDKWSFKNYWYMKHQDISYNNEYLNSVENGFLKKYGIRP